MGESGLVCWLRLVPPGRRHRTVHVERREGSSDESRRGDDVGIDEQEDGPSGGGRPGVSRRRSASVFGVANDAGAEVLRERCRAIGG